MSYGIWLERGDSRSEIEKVDPKSLPKGGTYRVSDSSELNEFDLEFNITYNFSWYFYETIDKDLGIRWIYGKKARDVVDNLKLAKEKCLSMAAMEETYGKILSETWGSGDPYDSEKVKNDYWYPCALHAAQAIDGVIQLAEIAPDFTFSGD